MIYNVDDALLFETLGNKDVWEVELWIEKKFNVFIELDDIALWSLDILCNLVEMTELVKNH